MMNLKVSRTTLQFYQVLLDPSPPPIPAPHGTPTKAPHKPQVSRTHTKKPDAHKKPRPHPKNQEYRRGTHNNPRISERKSTKLSSPCESP